MTDLTPLPPTVAPPADVPLETSKPYVAPSLTALGFVEMVTAGPDNGAIDQMVGGSGGFQRDLTS